jgi:hypothetical protein
VLYRRRIEQPMVQGTILRRQSASRSKATLRAFTVLSFWANGAVGGGCGACVCVNPTIVIIAIGGT